MAELLRSAAQNPEGKAGFNFHKLQAVLCMAASAAVSIGLVAWIIFG